MAVSKKLAAAYVEITARLDKFKSGLASARKATNRGVASMQARFSALAASTEAFSRRARRALLLLGGAVIGIGVLTTKMAMETEESENLFVVSMGKMADAARAWSEQTANALKVNRFELRKNIATFNVMLTSMGLGDEAAFEMARGLTQLAADMASFFNLRPEDAFQKLQAGISGEAEPLKRLGILINEVSVNTFAWTNGIAAQGVKLTEVQKVIARYGLIIERTKKAQGDLERTMDSSANRAKALKVQMEELAIKIGQDLMPTVRDLMTIVSDLLTGLNKLTPAQRAMIGTTIKWGLVALVAAGSVSMLAKAASNLLRIAMRLGALKTIAIVIVAPAVWKILEALQEIEAIKKRLAGDTGAAARVEEGARQFFAEDRTQDEIKDFRKKRLAGLKARALLSRQRLIDLRKLSAGRFEGRTRAERAPGFAAHRALPQAEAAERADREGFNAFLALDLDRIAAEEAAKRQKAKATAGGGAGGVGGGGVGGGGKQKLDIDRLRIERLRAEGRDREAELSELDKWWDEKVKLAKKGSAERIELERAFLAKNDALVKRWQDEDAAKADAHADRLAAIARKKAKEQAANKQEQADWEAGRERSKERRRQLKQQLADLGMRARTDQRFFREIVSSREKSFARAGGNIAGGPKGTLDEERNKILKEIAEGVRKPGGLP